jgi:hypothetical protein
MISFSMGAPVGLFCLDYDRKKGAMISMASQLRSTGFTVRMAAAPNGRSDRAPDRRDQAPQHQAGMTARHSPARRPFSVIASPRVCLRQAQGQAPRSNLDVTARDCFGVLRTPMTQATLAAPVGATNQGT